MTSTFLEIALASDELVASLQYYRALGFAELTTNDARDYAYAVVTDGRIVLGLHERSFDAPTLTLTQPDLAKHALTWSEDVALRHMQIDPDSFHEVLLADPDDHPLLLVEARTYSPATETLNQSLLGECVEWTYPVRQALISARFWAPFAPRALQTREQPDLHLRFASGDLPVGLSEAIAGRTGQLCYQTADLATLGQTADKLGTPLRPARTNLPDCDLQLITPEGLIINILSQDFLNAE